MGVGRRGCGARGGIGRGETGKPPTTPASVNKPGRRLSPRRRTQRRLGVASAQPLSPDTRSHAPSHLVLLAAPCCGLGASQPASRALFPPPRARGPWRRRHHHIGICPGVCVERGMRSTRRQHQSRFFFSPRPSPRLPSRGSSVILSDHRLRLPFSSRLSLTSFGSGVGFRAVVGRYEPPRTRRRFDPPQVWHPRPIGAPRGHPEQSS